MINSYRILVAKPEGKRPLGRPKSRWAYLKECGLDSSGSDWELVVGSCEHGNEPSGYIKGGELGE
jgi:hypothetical protein